MNIVETYSHGVQTKTFDGDTGTLYYHVLVQGRLVWRREARPRTHQKNLNALAVAQRHEAIHHVALAEREEKESHERHPDQLHA